MTNREEHYTMAAEVLDLAATYIERGWTQGAGARDGLGEPCRSISEDAVEWCADGAIAIASFRLNVIKAITISATEAFMLANNLLDVPAWNDREGQRADLVVRGIRRGAERARKEAA